MSGAAELIGAAAWPLVFLIVFFLMRRQVAALLIEFATFVRESDSWKLRAGVINVEGTSVARKARQELEATSPHKSMEALELSPPILPETAAGQSGGAVIEQAFIAVVTAVSARSTVTDINLSFSGLLEEIDLEDGLKTACITLDELHAHVIANPKVSLSSEFISEFVKLAKSILVRLADPDS